jgi:hypothetical protein
MLFSVKLSKLILHLSGSGTSTTCFTLQLVDTARVRGRVVVVLARSC